MRDKADSALLACTVVREPPCPVFKACSRSAASPAAHLAHDDVIRAVTERVADQDPGSSPLLPVDPPSLEADAIRAINAKLEGVLNGDDALVVGKQFNKCVKQGGLARSGAA